MFPPGQLRNALGPCFDIEENRTVEARLFLVIEVTRHGNVGDGGTLAQHKALADKMLVDDGIRALHAAPEKFDDRRIPALLNADHEAQRCEVARELVIVEQDPAPDFALLLGVAPAEPTGTLGKAVQDNTRLRNALALMFEHRQLAHLAHAIAKLILPRLAVEVI